MENFRQRAEELELTPVLSEISDDDVLQLLAQNVASGAYRFWEAAALAPPAVEEAYARQEAPAPQAEPVSEPAEKEVERAPVGQANAFRDAAKTGAPFCEI